MISLTCHHASGYAPRTKDNAELSDATIAIAIDFQTAGEKLTKSAADPRYLGIAFGAPLSEVRAALREFLIRYSVRELNVAGNGAYTFWRYGISQFEVNDYVFAVLSEVQSICPDIRFRSGGQTGVDHAALVSSARLDAPAVGLYPPGFLRRSKDGVDFRSDAGSILAEILAQSQQVRIPTTKVTQPSILSNLQAKTMITFEQLSTMRAGQTVYAGMYQATVLPDMDFETYSEAGFVWDDAAQKWVKPKGTAGTKKGLSVVGVQVYTEHPTFEVLSLKYDLKDGQGSRWWRPGMPLPQDLFDHAARGGLIEAHNVGFEVAVWERCVELYGWPPCPYAQMRCSMAKSRAFALPAALGKVSEVLGTLQKDEAGDALIKKFAIPQNPTKKRPTTRIRPEDDWPDFLRFVDYNETDIKAESHVSINVPDLSPIELEYWLVDQDINRRGVRVDLPTLRGAERVIDQCLALYGRQMEEITNGIGPTQLEKLKGWCGALGVQLEKMDEDVIEETLQRSDLPPLVRQVLELRARVGSASVKKIFQMLNRASKRERLHHLFLFHATRTGRPTGEGPQPTNLPKAGPNVYKCVCGRHYGETVHACPWCLRGPEYRVDSKGQYLPHGSKPNEWSPAAMYDAIEIVRTGEMRTVEMFFGDAFLTIAGCLRGLYIAADGHVFMSSDYTAIEAVVLACLAGEQWRIDLFRNKGKIYEKSGSLITGISYEDILAYKAQTGQHHPARQVGKTGELGLGYQGWINAWRQFDDSGTLSDDEIKKIILAWRKASPAIVEFWGGQSRRTHAGVVEDFHGVEGAFIRAFNSPGQWQQCGGLYFIRHENRVYIRLLSGRYLTYHDVQLWPSTKRGQTYDITFWGWNTNPKNGALNKWIQFYTWGGRLVENIVQATSNDILRYASVNLQRAGYPIVLHVYDEIVSEVPLGFGSLSEFERIMGDTPAWAVCPDGQRWPVDAAGGWVGSRYRKG